jgi:hypothetical protein
MARFAAVSDTVISITGIAAVIFDTRSPEDVSVLIMDIIAADEVPVTLA